MKMARKIRYRRYRRSGPRPAYTINHKYIRNLTWDALGVEAGLLPRFSWLITRLFLPLILLAIYLLLSILNANSRICLPTLDPTKEPGSIISGN